MESREFPTPIYSKVSNILNLHLYKKTLKIGTKNIGTYKRHWWQTESFSFNPKNNWACPCSAHPTTSRPWRWFESIFKVQFMSYRSQCRRQRSWTLHAVNWKIFTYALLEIAQSVFTYHSLTYDNSTFPVPLIKTTTIVSTFLQLLFLQRANLSS